ncbi:SAM hydrolase/SAM-dependent halogenase family protein [Sulfuracidifex tepidarius]|uniref:Chlorinase n=1 Tax=Sulfuracidifex tepidarius TaxID=1294262 RepID=A0A510E450_9CREN|nr:SAM-dependent chlorinase/fluorinase [Sulfuracidifex tepidarius]BBG24479.1 Chlorinase [Sulfuracidifex tepidarius]BBG27237.1 Chlorinase [Sulfuracidifex tepidarius]
MIRANNIAILTDFSLSDNYNGVMEGTIRRFNKDVNITYLSGNSKKFNVKSASYLLYTGYRFFPRKTVFLVVVDPGVGTERDALLVKTRNYFFIGPDNGVLYPSIIEDGIVEIRKINNPKVFLSKEISKTFHGRDIFAVSAALLSTGVETEAFGDVKSQNDLYKYELKYYEKINYGLKTKVVYVDNFGNVTLGITSREFKVKENQIYEINVKGLKYKVTSKRTFGYGEENQLIIYSNGYGFLEIGINKGSAYHTLKTSEGDEICLEDYTQGDSSPST